MRLVCSYHLHTLQNTPPTSSRPFINFQWKRLEKLLLMCLKIIKDMQEKKSRTRALVGPGGQLGAPFEETCRHRCPPCIFPSRRVSTFSNEHPSPPCRGSIGSILFFSEQLSLLGLAQRGEMISFICSMVREKTLKIITVYRKTN